VYENLWERIDLFFQATERGAKYEFLVKPGGNPSEIRISSRDYNSFEINVDSVKMQKGRYRDEGLVSLQEGRIIDSEFVKVDSNSYGFEIAEFDSRYPLSIDPLIYSTFVGAADDDRAARITQDSFGNILVAVYTESQDFPRVGPFTQFRGEADCIIYKMNPSDYSFISSIFMGGNGEEFITDLDVDDDGDVYISGRTESSDLPNNVTSYNGGLYDAFVIKLSRNLDQVIFSTYVGGSGADSGWSIALDAFGSVYLGGETSSNDFPTINALDDTLDGPSDAFIVKLNFNTDIVFSTYIGGSGVDGVTWGIDVDSEGNVYLTGYTSSSNFPTVDAFDTEFNGIRDCFISKVSSTGDELLYSTYIGGDNNDYGNAIKVDELDNMYVVGYTSSSDFPTVNPCCDYSGDEDCFILKMNPTGDSLIFSSFIGGSNSDQGWDLAFDARGSIYIVGFTLSDDFLLVNPVQASYEDLAEVFVTKITNNGSQIAYSTYLGGGGRDYGNSITVDSVENAIVVGNTDSIDFPVTSGVTEVDDEFNGGQYDSFLSIVPDMGDLDHDGLYGYEEREFGTDPYNNDSDSDQMDDKYELDYGLEPTEYDSDEDPDLDALSNLQEYLLKTDPNNPDTDGDGYSDGWEVFNGFSPIDAEVPVMEIVVYYLPLVIFAVGVVIFLAIVRALTPHYWKREDEKREMTIKEEERTALEALLATRDFEEVLGLEDTSNIPEEEEEDEDV
jgi:hypothetical protein